MTGAHIPSKEEIRSCLDFLTKTLAVTICAGDMERKEVCPEGTGILLTEDELIFENYYSYRFGQIYEKKRFGSTIRMNGSIQGVNQDKADFCVTFSGQELNFPITMQSNFRGGDTDITINGVKHRQEELLAIAATEVSDNPIV